MNTLSPMTESNAGALSAAPGITIIYEDRVSGFRAKRFSDLVNDALGGQPGEEPACWRSELIESPDLAAEIALDAAAGEFVILSLRGDAPLSPAMKRWIETWLAGAAGGPSSLVALFDAERSTAPHAEGIRCYLRHAAATAGVAFFAHSAVSCGGEVEAFAEEEREPATQSRPARRSRNLIASYFPTPAAA